MKLRLFKKITAAPLAVIAAAGCSMMQAIAEQQLSITAPANAQLTSSNTGFEWLQSESTGNLESWELTFNMQVSNLSHTDNFFNLGSPSTNAGYGYRLSVIGQDIILSRNYSPYVGGSPLITLSGVITEPNTNVPITISFVREIEEGAMLDTGTFTLTSGATTGSVRVETQDDDEYHPDPLYSHYSIRELNTMIYSDNTFGRLWTNQGNEKFYNITLTELDNQMVEIISYWKGTEGNNAWITSNFYPAHEDDDNYEYAKFTADGYTTVTVNSYVSAQKVDVTGADYTFDIVSWNSGLNVDKASVAGDASLTITGASYARIRTLSGTGDLTVGENCTVDVDALNEYNGTLSVRDGGTLRLGYDIILPNLTVEHGTVYSAHDGKQSGIGVITGTLTIGEDGTFKVWNHDAFGYGDTATKEIIMRGAANHFATLSFELDQKNPASEAISTDITMRGYSAITFNADVMGIKTYGCAINVEGVQNHIAIIDISQDVTITVAPNSELNVGCVTLNQQTDGTQIISKEGTGMLRLTGNSQMNGLNVIAGAVVFSGTSELNALSTTFCGSLELETGANLCVGNIVHMEANQTADAKLSGAIEATYIRMYGENKNVKGAMNNVCLSTTDVYTIENMIISGSLIDVGEGTTLYLVNVDIHSDTHITDEAAWLDLKATNGWLDKDNTQAVKEYTTAQDASLFKSGDTRRSITLAAGTEIVELTSDMFDTVTLTGTDLWLDMTGIAEATYNKDYFTLDFKNLAHSLENAQVDVDNLRIYATLDGERYTEAYSTANGGLTTTLYFAVPEPATSTLSLLALTALAARRRRK